MDNNIRRTSKTRGVNGGNSFFDESSGEFKKRPNPYYEQESAEVIKRTQINNFDNEDTERTVNKVLKRRKKYKKLPVTRLGKDKEDDTKEVENQESFEKLTPLKNKYKASDSIRMHMRHRDNKKKETTNTSKHETKQRNESKKTDKPAHVANNIHLQRSDRLKQQGSFKRENEYGLTEHLKLRQEAEDAKKEMKKESRENTNYQHYDHPEEVLLASGFHNQVSVQEPNYDFTIGDTRRSPLAPVDPILNHQFFPTPPPLKYPTYPGLYFPPTQNEDPKNVLTNYDFTIGNNGNPISQINPVLNYLNLSPKQPARMPTTPKPFSPTVLPTAVPTNIIPQPTRSNRKSHTTESVPSTGRRFPHFPSIEITDNYIDSFTARSSDTRKYKSSKHNSYKSTTRKPKKEQHQKSNFYDGFGLQNYKTTKNALNTEAVKSNYFDDNRFPSYQGMTTQKYKYPSNSQSYTTTSSKTYYTTLPPKESARNYQTTTKPFDRYENENTASESLDSFGSSNFFPKSNNKHNFFSDWGKKVEPSENNQKREIGKSSITTLKPKIKQPKIKMQAHDKENYQLKNYRTPVGSYPSMYGNQYSQEYNKRVTTTGHTTATYQPHTSLYTSFPAPKNIQTTPTTIFTNTPIAYTPSPSNQNTIQPYTPVHASYQNTPRSYTPTPAPFPDDFVTQRSFSKAGNYAQHVPSDKKNLERGPLRKELYANPEVNKNKQGATEFGNRFYSGFQNFGPNHLKPHHPAITFLEPSSPSPLEERRQTNNQPAERLQTHRRPAERLRTHSRPSERLQTQNQPAERLLTRSRPAETKHAPSRDPGNVFNQPAAFENFFQYPSFEQRQELGNNFQQFGQAGFNTVNQPHTVGNPNYHQAGNQQVSSQYYQQGVRSQSIAPGSEDTDTNSEMTVPRKKKQQNKHAAHARGKRKRKTAQFDNRPKGGYSINVFNNTGKNYSIFDGNFNKNVEPVFGNNNNPERQHDAMNKSRQFKRNIAQQGLRTDNQNPWPNDKHWNNQQYESRELGDHIPFLF